MKYIAIIDHYAYDEYDDKGYAHVGIHMNVVGCVFKYTIEKVEDD